MSGRKLGVFLASVSFVVITVVGIASKRMDSMALYYVGLVLFILWGIACVRWGEFFKTLWIGPTYETMERELQDLRHDLHRASVVRGKNLDPQLKRKMEKRIQKVEERMGEYRKLQR